ncbi:hypothetical protein ADN00_11600 [Ornatilinea apprima]|uniref:Zinc-finger domain-containing protein n=1 Tax=Ornatilinea apprima TaxID=1134406 RepID=A0A0N8GMR1_9CHLR|nr:hypothetical protein [Ornatilinea apprima]KPL76002.1 hypothetical protein ADN00_11600 [Ornatilinea apprima]
MNHQPFEKWIFEEDDLTPKELELFSEHLEECNECTGLRASLHQVEQRLRVAPILAPSPGFADRWKASLAERTAREQQRQVRKFLTTLFLSGGLLFVLIFSQLLLTSSPTDWLITGIQFTTLSVLRFNQLPQVIMTFLQILPPAIPIVVWVFATVTFSLLGILWAGTIWRLSTRGVHNL